MPKIKSILGRINGTMDEVSFYQSKGESYVRRKGGVSGERIASDDGFAETRLNNAEFGHIAKMGKLLRNGIKPFIKASADSEVVFRMTKLMSQVRNLDVTHEKGGRTVETGISTLGGKEILKGFEFNQKAPMGVVMVKPFNLNPATGVVTIPGLMAKADLESPDGATHVRFQSAWMKVDFGSGNSETEYSNDALIPLNSVAGDVMLTPVAVPAGAGTSFFVLAIRFVNITNGFEHPLKNKSFNAMKIVDVV